VESLDISPTGYKGPPASASSTPWAGPFSSNGCPPQPPPTPPPSTPAAWPPAYTGSASGRAVK